MSDSTVDTLPTARTDSDGRSGASDLGALAATALESVSASADEWRAFVVDEVHDPLVSTLTEARRRHRDAIAAFSEVPRDGRAIWSAIITYRRAAHDDVLRPILLVLRETAPARRLGDRFVAFLNESRASQRSIPEVIEVDEPPDLFAPDVDDGIRRSLRKSFERMRRRFIRTEPKPRVVRARDVIGFHIGARVALLYTPVHEALLRRFAQTESAIERALTVWSNAVLVAERDIEISDVHQPAVVEAWYGRDDAADSDAADSDAADSDATDPEATVSDATVSDAAHSDAADSDATDADAADHDSKYDELAETIAYVRALARELDEALGAIVEKRLELPDVDPDLVDVADRTLRRDLAESGTALAEFRDAPPPPEGYGPAAAAARKRDRWDAWHRQVIARLELAHHALGLRSRMIAAADDMLASVAERSLKPVFDTADRIDSELARWREESDAACDAARSTGDVDALHASLTGIRARAGRFFARTLRTLTGLVDADEALADPGGHAWSDFVRSLDGLPESLEIHGLPDEGAAPANPETATRRVELRGIARRTLDGAMKSLQSGTEPLRANLRAVWTRIEEVQNVVLFNLDTALTEVAAIRDGEATEEDETTDDDGAGTAGRPAKSDGERAAERADELANDGLARAREITAGFGSGLREPWDTFAEATTERVRDLWIATLRRMRTGEETDQEWEGLWEGLVRRGRLTWRSLVANARTWWPSAVGFSGRIGARIRRLVKIGQTAVGGVQSTEEDLSATVDAMWDVADLRRSLPIVYRHLFAFDPLTEPTLHEGRDDDLDWLGKQFDRWLTTPRGGAIALSAPLGAGRTSLLNVAAASDVFGAATVYRVTIDRRIASEEVLAGLLADALELVSESESESADPSESDHATLADLEAAILDLPETRDRVCLIDDLEHLIMRTPGGTDLVERLMTFMSRTDSLIFWVAAVNDLAWRFIESSASGTASTFLRHRSLKPFNAASLEELVLARHRRSGMQLRFEAPQSQGDTWRNWFRRRRTDEVRQAAIRQQYFERLYRECEQNVMLALYRWIRSCRFDRQKGIVTVEPLQTLPHDALGRMPLDALFSLETFLVHKTLSADEHAAVTRFENVESDLLLESLLNRRLIEEVRADAEPRAASRGSSSDADPRAASAPADDHSGSPGIERAARYRIHPLLLSAVGSALRKKHIVY